MRIVKFFIYYFSFFLLSGCVLNLLEYSQPENANKIFDNGATLPTRERDFTGFVQVGDNIPIERVSDWMEKRCREISGGGFTVGNRWKGTAGPHSTPNHYKCVPDLNIPVSSNLKVETKISPPIFTYVPAMTIEIAKTKCDELGFKQGTEGFGKCVLQLTK
jgi:hypothetical protein